MARGACGVHWARCASRAWQERVTASPENTVSHRRPTRARHAEPRHRPVPRRAGLPLPRRLDRPRRQQQHRGRAALGMADQERLHAGADQRRALQAAHRGGQPQPHALRQQPGRLQPAALRRAGEDRGGQGHRDRPPHQLGRAGEERLRHRRGSDAQGQPRAAARPRALRQRHRRRRARAEEQPRVHRRRHPPDASPTSSRSSTSGSSARCSSSSPATTPRGCSTARSARRRSTS